MLIVPPEKINLRQFHHGTKIVGDLPERLPQVALSVFRLAQVELGERQHVQRIGIAGGGGEKILHALLAFFLQLRVATARHELG